MLYFSNDPKSNPYAGYVRHFVAWRFLSTVSNDTKAEVMQRYTSLQYKCVNETTGKYHATYSNNYRWSNSGVLIIAIHSK